MWTFTNTSLPLIEITYFNENNLENNLRTIVEIWWTSSDEIWDIKILAQKNCALRDTKFHLFYKKKKNVIYFRSYNTTNRKAIHFRHSNGTEDLKLFKPLIYHLPIDLPSTWKKILFACSLNEISNARVYVLVPSPPFFHLWKTIDASASDLHRSGDGVRAGASSTASRKSGVKGEGESRDKWSVE